MLYAKFLTNQFFTIPATFLLHRKLFDSISWMSVSWVGCKNYEVFHYSVIQYFQLGCYTFLWMYSVRLLYKSLYFVFFCNSKRASKRRNNLACAWITSSIWWEPCCSCYLLSLSVLHNRLPCDLVHHLTLHPSEPSTSSVSSVGWSLTFSPVSLK